MKVVSESVLIFQVLNLNFKQEERTHKKIKRHAFQEHCEPSVNMSRCICDWGFFDIIGSILSK